MKKKKMVLSTITVLFVVVLWSCESTFAGHLVAWGDNSYGQCDVPAGSDFMAIATGHWHSLALKSDGSLVAWGDNSYGQCDVPAGNDFVAIAAGPLHNLAIKSNGSLVGWSDNRCGEINVPSGNDFVAIAAGQQFSLALKSDGSLVGWGDNSIGQIDVPAGNDFGAITAGYHHSLALKSNGSLVGWGYNSTGQIDVPDGNDFEAISTGHNHGLALKSNGLLVGWGANDFGQIDVPDGNDFIAIAASTINHSLALKSDGSLVGWGRNIYGEIDVPAGNDFAAIAAGGYHSLALVAEPVCWVEEAKLLASDGAAGDQFGVSVALSGATALVGAHIDDDASGSAYLLDVTTGSQIAKLTASDATAGDQFGVSVALSGTTGLVGARMDYVDVSQAGSAYLFDFSDPCNIIEIKLISPNPWFEGHFGESVALSGTMALVGADGESSDSGSAYLFDFSGPCNIKEIQLTASDAAAGDYFGISVALSGDYAIVGAFRADPCGINDAGAAYVFKNDGTSWMEQAILTASDKEANDNFGISVALSGTIALVGAYRDDDGGIDSGSAYIFEKPVGGWVDMTETVKLTASDAAEYDWFGTRSVALSGTTALVGASSYDDPGGDSGSAYIFEKPVGGWVDMTETVKLTASDATDHDLFGWSMALSGSTALVGAILDDDKGSNSGSVYVFENICNAEPVAICQDVTVEADGNCEGIVTAEDVDEGSYDPDGDEIALSLEPEGPYPLGETSVTLTVSDCLESAMCEATITVVDTTPPVIRSVDADYLLAAVGQTVNFSVDVNDECDSNVDVEWDFGDGTPASSEPSHAYGEPGIYTAGVTATDDCGNSSTDSIIIVVYDPSAGFTSGGGWFVPDGNSFIDGNDVTDTVSKANFGFIVKYKKGADNPDGNLEFQYKAGDINLRSTDMEWLVVQSATKVRFKGLATINGEGSYTFKVTAEDNGEPGTGDWFKIEIWMGPDVDTENSPPTPKHKAQGYLGGGNIQIHQK